MKNILTFILFFLGFICKIYAQNSGVRTEGKVTFISASNIYVSFEETTGLKVNDTLLLFNNNEWKKALIVKVVSTKSCLTTSISGHQIKVGDKVGFLKPELPETKTQPKSIEIKKNEPKPTISNSIKIDSSKKLKQQIDGRVMLSVNGSMDDTEKKYNRYRGSFMFDVKNINGGKFSFENYINYQHRFSSSQQPPTTFNDDFKVYSLSINYDMNEHTSISLGRKINDKMANMGAIDGLQFQTKQKKLIFGSFVGFNPDYLDYSFNSKLFQVGGFVAHETENKNGQIQTSIAFADQENNFKTDRRFLYFQHSNSALKNLHIFYSLELDLFQNVNGIKTNNIDLTSTYLSVRYRPHRKLSISASYDNRKNVIYYETFRSYIDQLLTQETRQGIRLQVNHNLSKYLSFNASGFYRYQESRPDPTKNYVVNITVSQIMGLGSYLNLNVNTMNTYYFGGTIMGARLNKDLFKSKVSTELNFRKVNYDFYNIEQPKLSQNIFGVSANIYGSKRTSLMLTYEGTFEPTKNYNRYYITFSQRFRTKK